MDTPILIIYTLHSVYIVSHPTVHRSGHPNKAIWLAVFHLHVFDFVYNFGIKTLKPEVIPTLFNFPDHLKKTQRKQRSLRLKQPPRKEVSLM